MFTDGPWSWILLLGFKNQPSALLPLCTHLIKSLLGSEPMCCNGSPLCLGPSCDMVWFLVHCVVHSVPWSMVWPPILTFLAQLASPLALLQIESLPGRARSCYSLSAPSLHPTAGIWKDAHRGARLIRGEERGRDPKVDELHAMFFGHTPPCTVAMHC